MIVDTADYRHIFMLLIIDTVADDRHCWLCVLFLFALPLHIDDRADNRLLDYPRSVHDRCKKLSAQTTYLLPPTLSANGNT